MSLADDKRLLVEIASLYYEQNKTQEEIAQETKESLNLRSMISLRDPIESWKSS